MNTIDDKHHGPKDFWNKKRRYDIRHPQHQNVVGSLKEAQLTLTHISIQKSKISELQLANKRTSVSEIPTVEPWKEQHIVDATPTNSSIFGLLFQSCVCDETADERERNKPPNLLYNTYNPRDIDLPPTPKYLQYLNGFRGKKELDFDLVNDKKNNRSIRGIGRLRNILLEREATVEDKIFKFLCIYKKIEVRTEHPAHSSEEEQSTSEISSSTIFRRQRRNEEHHQPARQRNSGLCAVANFL